MLSTPRHPLPPHSTQADITAKGESVANLADILGTLAGIALSKARLPMVPTFAVLSAGYLIASRKVGRSFCCMLCCGVFCAALCFVLSVWRGAACGLPPSSPFCPRTPPTHPPPHTQPQEVDSVELPYLNRAPPPPRTHLPIRTH